MIRDSNRIDRVGEHFESNMARSSFNSPAGTKRSTAATKNGCFAVVVMTCPRTTSSMTELEGIDYGVKDIPQNHHQTGNGVGVAQRLK
jgi:hypothetical protein